MVDIILSFAQIVTLSIVAVGSTVVFCYVMNIIMSIMGAPHDE